MKDTRFPRSWFMVSLVHKFVRQIIISQTGMVARDVLSLLENFEFISMYRTNPHFVISLKWYVSCFLLRSIYKTGNNSASIIDSSAFL